MAISPCYFFVIYKIEYRYSIITEEKEFIHLSESGKKMYKQLFEWEDEPDFRNPRSSVSDSAHSLMLIGSVGTFTTTIGSEPLSVLFLIMHLGNRFVGIPEGAKLMDDFKHTFCKPCMLDNRLIPMVRNMYNNEALATIIPFSDKTEVRLYSTAERLNKMLCPTDLSKKMFEHFEKNGHKISFHSQVYFDETDGSFVIMCRERVFKMTIEGFYTDNRLHAFSSNKGFTM